VHRRLAEPNRIFIDVFYADGAALRVETEQLLVDFNLLVATVGGSLGMLLGLTCMDAVGWMGKALSYLQRIAPAS